MKKIILLCLLMISSVSAVSQSTTLQEGFENWPPADWSIYELGVALDGWRQDFENIGHTGIHSAYSSIDNSQCDNWMVTPQISIINNNYNLKFWDYHKTVEFYDRASVHISTGSGNPADGDFVEVYFTSEPIPTETWIERSIDLSSYVGQDIYVAFRYEGTWHEWYVDDVSVSPDVFTDGALIEIVNPVGVSENPSTEDVIIRLENTGTTTIQDVAINWMINGVSQTPFNAVGINLASGNSTNLTVGNYNFSTPGLYTIDATLVLADDFNGLNNDISGNYSISTVKDGALIAITPEGMIPATGVQEIIATIENIGVNSIDMTEINWTVNGVPQTPYSNPTLNLLPGNSVNVNIGTYNFTSSGVYEIDAILDVLGDTNQDNDEYLASVAVDTFYESFEGNQFPPEHWSIVFGVKDNSNFGNPVEGDKYYSSYADSNFFGVVSDTIYSPRLTIVPGDTYSFYIQTNSFFLGNHDLIWKDGTTGEVHVIQSINSTPNQWQQITMNITAAQGNNYIGITTTGGSYAESKFDLFTSTAKLHLYDHDLEIKNGDIYFLAGNNVNEGYDCVIKNVGGLPVLGANYTVKLMEAPGTVLATVNGVNLDSWEEATVTVNHTFVGEGSHRLYFEIEYAQDEELNNNTFREADVHVVAATAILDEMGPKGEINLNYPFNAYGSTMTLGEDDISQTLYLNSDFENPGEIYGLVYSYDNLLVSDRVQELPLKVWISQTQSDDLSGGYIPNAELVLVYDGVVEILPGFGRELYIPFLEPIPYSGIDNIVVQDYQYDPEWWPSILRFYGSDVIGPNIRTISNLEVFDLDPLNPPTTFSSHESYTHTRFVINPQVNTSIVSGNVKDTSSVPIADATVSIDGTSITAQTDVNGNYELIALPYGTYDITASKFGYFDQTLSTILDAPTTAQNFILEERALVEINGRVVGSNNIAIPLENVQISMTGYVNENTTSNSLGEFTFPTVYGGSDYTLTFNLYGYFEKTVVVSVIDQPIDLGDVVMDQEFISPFDVSVTVDTETTVTWKSPLLSSKVKLQNDLGMISNSFTNEPNENVWLGNFFEISEITTLTSIEIRTDIYSNAVDFVTIDVFDRATEEILASSHPFLILQNEVQVIDIPNIVVYEDILVAVHWQNNPESTNSLVVDFSDENIPNTAIIKYPGQPYELLSDFLGGPNMSFHVRVNSLDDGTPDTNNEVLSYNVHRGLASEFPDISNWELLNTSPITETTLVDTDWGSTLPSEQYRYAVETIYSEELSEVTFSNVIDGNILNVSEEVLLNSIVIYPIPAKDLLNIRTQYPVDDRSEIILLNVLGQNVDQFVPEFGSENIVKDISRLANGIYFVKMSINNVEITKKFIVSR
jgi:Carboxypeptidase regulatory-like domain/Secretion system C-terminal sorting domain